MGLSLTYEPENFTIINRPLRNHISFPVLNISLLNQISVIILTSLFNNRLFESFSQDSVANILLLESTFYQIVTYIKEDTTFNYLNRITAFSTL